VSAPARTDRPFADGTNIELLQQVGQTVLASIAPESCDEG
jgi:hypothetical protein